MDKPAAHTRPAVPPPPLRNIRLRFFLGPTNLGILQSLGKVMEEHPVVVHQHDYRLDVFGRPQDVVEAIIEGLLGVDLPAALQQQQCPDRALHVAFAPHVEGEPDMASDTFAAAKQLESCSIQESETHAPPREHSSPSDSAAPQRQHCVPVEERKTDYHLERARRSHNAPTARTPLPLTIILSMPELIAHYLIHRSGGFLSYLVERQDLESCERQGMPFEALKSMGKDAGLSVGISRFRLSAVDREIPVWIQADDMRAIRAVLEGVAWALATEPIYSKERGLITHDDFVMRMTCMSKLQNRDRPADNNVDDDGWVTSRGKGKQRTDGGDRWNVPGAGATQDRPQMKGGSARAQNEGGDRFRWGSWDQPRAVDPQDTVHPEGWDGQQPKAESRKEEHQKSRKKRIPTPPDFTPTTSQSAENFFMEDEVEEASAASEKEDGWVGSKGPSPTSPGVHRGRRRDRKGNKRSSRGHGASLAPSHHTGGASAVVVGGKTSGASASSGCSTPSTAISLHGGAAASWEVADADVDDVMLVAEWARPDLLAQVMVWQQEAEARPFTRIDRSRSSSGMQPRPHR